MPDYRVNAVLALISSRFREPLTLQAMSEHVNLSKSHLASLFRLAGTTAHRALTKARMEHAAELLSTTHLRVKEVADRVGIADQSHFVRDFEKYYHLHPQAFRRNHYLRS